MPSGTQDLPEPSTGTDLTSQTNSTDLSPLLDRPIIVNIYQTAPQRLSEVAEMIRSFDYAEIEKAVEARLQFDPGNVFQMTLELIAEVLDGIEP